MYSEGMTRLYNPSSNGGVRGSGHFRGILDALTYSDTYSRSEDGARVSTLKSSSDWEDFLHEQLEDGAWVYRCDELTRFYALASYRWAILHADYEDYRLARNLFCFGLQVRPEVVLEVATKEALSASARASFDAAVRDPKCMPEGGWRKYTEK